LLGLSTAQEPWRLHPREKRNPRACRGRSCRKGKRPARSWRQPTRISIINLLNLQL